MKSEQIIKKYLDFFQEKGHKQIPNTSLIPQEDSTLLFVNSGMFPLVPYLLGEPHPLGSRLVNVQRAFRMEDIDEIGDSRHTLAFHMLGNWSLGDYFKEEQLNWFYEFLIEVLGLDPERIYSTVFSGDNDAPRDDESINILKAIYKNYGIDAEVGSRIFLYGKDMNWWQRGDSVGELGGPDSETFYYIGDGTPKGTPATQEDLFIEVGNSVFLQYQKTTSGWKELSKKNVDFGGGLERLALVLQNKKDIFTTDNFYPIIERIQQISGKDYLDNENNTRQMRIIADHARASVFLAMDGVLPSNKDQGYMLRRLLRRVVRAGRSLNIEKEMSAELTDIVCDMFSWLYPELSAKKSSIKKLFEDEEKKFQKTLDKGSEQIRKKEDYINERIIKAGEHEAIENAAFLGFDLYQSYGYPLEMFLEDLREKNVNVDYEKITERYEEIFNQHQDRSREGAEQKFKGGLADHSEEVIKYHTATHLLHRGLINTLGDHVTQVGSNITNERLRFDFTHEERLTDKQIVDVESFVNDTIEASLPVNFEMVPKEEAIELGSRYIENESYPDQVKVYYVGQSLKDSVSKEFCGGPHVSNTSELNQLKIFKQDKVGDEKIRIYAKFAKK